MGRGRPHSNHPVGLRGRFGDELDLVVAVTRWGRTSFDVGVAGSVGERPVFTAHLVYVSTTPGAPVPTPVPEKVRELLTEASV